MAGARARERVVLAVLAAIVGIALYLSLLHAADRGRTQLLASVAVLRAKATLLEQHAAEHERLRSAPAPAGSAADLRSVIQARADAARLALTRIDARDADHVQVTLGAVAFADWLAWTAVLQAQQVRLETARIEALAAPGLVSVSATFARSPGRVVRWIALGVVFVFTLVALAPATLIDAHLERTSDGRVRLAEASGSLWSGTGWIEIRDADGRAGLAKRLAWRVLPESLPRGRLVAELTLDGKAFRLASSLSRLEIAGAAIHLPAAALAAGMPRLAPFGLTGDVVVGIPRLSLERGRIEGDATVQWHAAGSTLTPVSPLGAYEVQLKAVGAEVHAALRTLEGPLQLDGKGTWSSATAPKFLATARIPAQHQEQLAPLFRLFAAERSAGTFELRL